MYICIFIGIIFLLGLPYKIDKEIYTIQSAKIKQPVKVCVLADFHCRKFGEKQSKIVDIIKKEKPDCIVFPGDLLDDRYPVENVYTLIKELQDYPMYYSLGNHDSSSPELLNPFLKQIQEMGVHFLKDKSSSLLLNDDKVEILGLHDLRTHEKKDANQINQLFQTDQYRIVLSHRPHYIDLYSSIDCDLIISGHVHGGQWRTPITKKGVYSPNKGFFPNYIQGIHLLNKQYLYISRGLATGIAPIPRLYNNPEVGFIIIEPMKE